jgi:hypothetical protein
MSYASVSQNDSHDSAASAATPGSEFISIAPPASGSSSNEPQHNEQPGGERSALPPLDENERRPRSSSGWLACCDITAYSHLFDVTAYQVLERILLALSPFPKSSRIPPKSYDLYGPFWTCTSLVFMASVAGTLRHYFTGRVKRTTLFDFAELTTTAALVFGYWLLAPLAVLLIERGLRRAVEARRTREQREDPLFSGLPSFTDATAAGASTSASGTSAALPNANAGRLSFADLLATYGYSLACYVPLVALWLFFPVFLRIIAALVAAIFSGLSFCGLSLTLAAHT